jgi:hypothetical protein
MMTLSDKLPGNTYLLETSKYLGEAAKLYTSPNTDNNKFALIH